MISNLIIDTMPGNPWSPDKANFGVYQTSEFQGKDKVTRVALQEHMTLLEVEVKQCGKVNPRREVVTGLYLTEALNLKKALEGSK